MTEEKQALLNPEITDDFPLSRIGLYGLAVMGQNFALNIASRGVLISVSNRSNSKIDACVARANNAVDPNGNPESCATLRGFHEWEDFIKSIARPRPIILLVQAGRPVEAVISKLLSTLDAGDMIIDGGNEWYVNSEDRIMRAHQNSIWYLAMGVSGGEKGARYGPSLMPGGDRYVYEQIYDILEAVAAKPDPAEFGDEIPCVTYLGPQGFGNYVKMVHNGIEYGDMQLIAEAYDLLQKMCGMSNDDLARTFEEYFNDADLRSYLIEITYKIFQKKDDIGTDEANNRYLVDQVVDSTGSKGTGMWTVKELAEQGISGPTISAALNMRYMSSVRQERIAAEGVLGLVDCAQLEGDAAAQFVRDVRDALVASKICSYAQGMNLIKEFANKTRARYDRQPVPNEPHEPLPDEWPNMGEIAKIWRAGCIIRANFLNEITAAYDADPNLASLLVSDTFVGKLKTAEAGWRRVVQAAVGNGVPVPAISGSLAYFDAYRRGRLPANLTQAQRDFFGSHTYLRMDDADGPKVHSEWPEPTGLRYDLR